MVEMRRDTILDLFASLADIDGPFLDYDDGYRSHSHTYKQTAGAARTFAARLELAGISKGDSVLFWAENRPEWIVAFWGCALRGAIVVPLDYRASPELLLRVQAIAKAKLLLAGDEVTVPTVSIPVWTITSVEWTSTDMDFAPSAISRDDVVEILFTSGATAEPKGVIIQHKNILANVVPVEREMQKYKKYAKPFQPIRFLNLLPLSHMFGQAMATFIPLCCRELSFSSAGTTRMRSSAISTRAVSLSWSAFPRFWMSFASTCCGPFPKLRSRLRRVLIG